MCARINSVKNKIRIAIHFDFMVTLKSKPQSSSPVPLIKKHIAESLPTGISTVTCESMKNRHLPFLPGFISPSWSIQYSRISISTFPLKSRTLTYLIFPILKTKQKQRNNITYNICSVVMLYQVKLNIYVIISLLDHSPGTCYL